MTNLQRGLILAGAQLALVASLFAKYAMDRARLPRVWVQTVAYDPNLPIRGRYLSVRLRVLPEDVYGSPWNLSGEMRDVTLNPSVRSAGVELWMEVTVPKTGPPRPIQLAIKRGESFTPLGMK